MANVPATNSNSSKRLIIFLFLPCYYEADPSQPLLRPYAYPGLEDLLWGIFLHGHGLTWVDTFMVEPWIFKVAGRFFGDKENARTRLPTGDQ